MTAEALDRRQEDSAVLIRQLQGRVAALEAKLADIGAIYGPFSYAVGALAAGSTANSGSQADNLGTTNKRILADLDMGSTTPRATIGYDIIDADHHNIYVLNNTGAAMNANDVIRYFIVVDG